MRDLRPRRRFRCLKLPRQNRVQRGDRDRHVGVARHSNAINRRGMSRFAMVTLLLDFPCHDYLSMIYCPATLLCLILRLADTIPLIYCSFFIFLLLWSSIDAKSSLRLIVLSRRRIEYLRSPRYCLWPSNQGLGSSQCRKTQNITQPNPKETTWVSY
jgi:hypothetical protein